MSLWSDRIAAANSSEALQATVREYLASIEPGELLHVPAWIASIRVKGLDDLAYWQARLAEEYCDGGALRDAEAAIVSQLLAFFTAACERSERLARSGGSSESARSLFSDDSIPKLFREQAPPL